MAHLGIMIKATLSAALFALALAAPVQAQGVPENAVQATIVPGWLRADGTRVAALQLTLAPGWKTYWRAPGDTGIPPQFNWSGSRNLAGVGISWPAPQVYREGGIRTIGYKDRLVLPLTLAPRQADKPIELNLDLDLGVCRDICIPAQLSLSATLADSNPNPTPAIAAALAARPYSAREAGVKQADCALRPNATGLEIEARLTLPPTGGREVVVIEPGQPNLWMSEMDTKRKGNQLVATGDLSAYEGGGIALDRSGIRITVIGKNHAVEINGCTPG